MKKEDQLTFPMRVHLSIERFFNSVNFQFNNILFTYSRYHLQEYNLDEYEIRNQPYIKLSKGLNHKFMSRNGFEPSITIILIN